MTSNGFQVETVRLPLARLPRAFSGFRLAQISDIHMGGWMNRARFQQVAELVAAENPDVLVITGDFLIGRGFKEISRRWIDDIVQVLTPLAAAIPSFAVMGNHDYWTNPNAIRDMFGRSGVTDLTNTVFTLTRSGQHLHLCGVDDIRHGDVRLDEVIARLRENSAAILAVHEPDYADISAATGKFDLQIAGHTHGGQVVFPFCGAPILPGSGKRYPSGLYKIGNMYQYTNRGVGMNEFAVRFNCPAEITLFVLESMDLLPAASMAVQTDELLPL